MINKNLTLESALAELGDIEAIFTKQLDSTHPFSQILQAYDEQVRAALKIGEAYTIPGFLGNSLYFANVVPEEMQKKIAAIARSMSSSRRGVLFDGNGFFLRINDNYPDGEIFESSLDYIDTVLEAVQNAIEHGTQYCSHDKIHIRAALSARGALVCIHQSTRGPSNEQLDRLYNAAPEDDMRYKVGNMVRGNGFTRFVRERHTEVNFIDSDNTANMCLLKLNVPIQPLEKF